MECEARSEAPDMRAYVAPFRHGVVMEAETPAGRSDRRRIGYAVLTAAVVLLLVGVVAFVLSRGRNGDDTPGVGPVDSPAQSGIGDSPAPSWSAVAPSAPADVTVAWAFVDSTEGDTRTGGDDQVLHPLLDTVVPLVAADYLNANKDADGGPPPAQSEKLTAAMTGDRLAVAWLLEERGGVNAAMKRIIDACAVPQAEVSPPQATVLDIARLGACLREGAIVEPVWAEWVLTQMRAVTGGIGDVRGSDTAQNLAQFNSTVRDEDDYRTVCLAVGAWWSAAVTVEYPAARGKDYGVTACRDTALDAFPPDTQQVPDNLSPSPTTARA